MSQQQTLVYFALKQEVVDNQYCHLVEKVIRELDAMHVRSIKGAGRPLSCNECGVVAALATRQ
jgi:hypothetical protein